LPGYVEDVDLCYRGWKAGYKGYYEPASVVYHKGRETFKKFYDEKKMLVFSYRNTFLFVWKNMGVLSLAGHFFMLPLTVAVFVFTGRFLHVLGVVEAFQKAGSIKRQKSKLNETVAYKLANSDDEIVIGETKGNKRQDSEELGEPAGQGPAMCFPESALAHKLLDGLRGLEIGGSAHNPFGLNTKNVDYTGDMNTVFKREEVKICGKAMPVDIVAYGDKLPVQDNSQDFVVSSHVLEHFFDPIAALKEWYRVVKNGGYLFMIVPHKERTFDKEKERTTLKELIGRHEGRFKNRKLNYHDHFSFWITEDVVEIIKYLNWEIAEIMDTDDKVGNGFTVAVKVVK
ncbi:MAG: methyltransferase domain-containing protein, partial [Candidatus Goldbacteria bacterium]|nr:methyltransferase domain-containing protein [Candidatus Goldiibacteriota bacterium]